MAHRLEGVAVFIAVCVWLIDWLIVPLLLGGTLVAEALINAASGARRGPIK
jgi:hypothetical protein